MPVMTIADNTWTLRRGGSARMASRFACMVAAGYLKHERDTEDGAVYRVIGSIHEWRAGDAAWRAANGLPAHPGSRYCDNGDEIVSGQKIIEGLKEAVEHAKLDAFLTESNAIEGIHRPVSSFEYAAFAKFLALDKVTLEALGELQAMFAPGKPLRDRDDMNVRVGEYVAPAGGSAMAGMLSSLCADVTSNYDTPWRNHVRFEKLHPYLDGNGRTGRALWAWQMLRNGQDPFALSFLHRWYYQTLAAA